MNSGQLQSLKDLIEFLKRQEICEFELEQDDLKVRLSFIGKGGSGDPAIQLERTAAPLQAAERRASHTATESGNLAASASSDEDELAGLHIVKSPIVGTFYEAAAPGADPFVKVGDPVEAGQVICIVEAMKLMNEIECDASGEIVKRMVASGQPVEYGQALFAIRPR